MDSRPKQPAERFSADRPIEGRVQDRLGRRQFAEAIASAVRGWVGHDSLVIGLYGVWGSGKSSVKNMVIEALNEGAGSRSEIAEFNSWEFPNREKLSAAFFDQIGIAIGRREVGRIQESEDGCQRGTHRWVAWSGRRRSSRIWARRHEQNSW